MANHGVLESLCEQQDREIAQDILDTAVANLTGEFRWGEFKGYPRAEAKIREDLGHAYLWYVKDYKAAEDQFKHSLRINPNPGHKLNGWNALGMAYYLQGRYEEAVEELERVLERYRSQKVQDWHSIAWDNFIIVYKAQGRDEEAEQLIIERNNRHPKYLKDSNSEE